MVALAFGGLVLAESMPVWVVFVLAQVEVEASMLVALVGRVEKLEEWVVEASMLVERQQVLSE